MTAPSTPTSSQPTSASPGSLTRFTGLRRRSVPHLVVGAVLVTTCAAGGVWWSTQAGDRDLALVLARPVPLGTALAMPDLRQASVALDGTVDAIPAREASSVVGQRLAVSLPAGALLPRHALGVPAGPPAGRAVAALALEPGQASPDLIAGVPVLVMVNAESTSPAATPLGGWRGLVTHVMDLPTGAGRVVSIELGLDDARRVAAAPAGRLSLVVVGGER
jgi:hypothetical protein